MQKYAANKLKCHQPSAQKSQWGSASIVLNVFIRYRTQFPGAPDVILDEKNQDDRETLWTTWNVKLRRSQEDFDILSRDGGILFNPLRLAKLAP